MDAANAVTITNIPTYYTQIILVLNALSMDTNARVPFVRLSTDNGSNYDSSNYQWGIQELGIAPSSATDRIFGSPGMDAGDTLNAVATFSGMVAGPWPHCVQVGKDSGGATYIGQGIFQNPGAVNAMQIIMNGTGNFDGGSYALYGVR